MAMVIVFQINSNSSGPGGLADGLRDIGRLYTVSGLDIRSYRHVDTCGNNGNLAHHCRAVDSLPIAQSAGISDARARRADRDETCFLEDPCAGRIPSIR